MEAPKHITPRSLGSVPLSPGGRGFESRRSRPQKPRESGAFCLGGSAQGSPSRRWVPRVADTLASQRHHGLERTARVLALTDIALADATIAIWNAKNAYDRWRPITAIARADTDGNPATIAHPTWTPLLTTAAFQEYPAAHPGVSAAAASVLAAQYRDHTGFTVTSAGLPGVDRAFTSFAAAAPAGPRGADLRRHPLPLLHHHRRPHGRLDRRLPPRPPHAATARVTRRAHSHNVRARTRAPAHHPTSTPSTPADNPSSARPATGGRGSGTQPARPLCRCRRHWAHPAMRSRAPPLVLPGWSKRRFSLARLPRCDGDGA